MSVVSERHGAVEVITLSRPERMNAVNGALRDGLIAALRAANDDPQVGAIVLTGAGDRAFCAGQDLEESRAVAHVDLPRWLSHQRAMYQAVRDLDKGCVAALNGVAAGAGFQLALCADLRIGHAGIRIGQPELKAGLASIVGSYLMTLHVGLSVNTQLSLAGDLITGTEAHRLTLINELVAPEAVLETALARAEAMAALPRTAMRVSKARFRSLTQPGFDAACDAAVGLQMECYASGEPQAAQEAFLARRTRKELTGKTQ
ncbi:enoyl-CoA hydratase/isomerase family protein [Leisingera daeponensis]|uniref:Enoyl-CoA hydratase/isomerase family protein n=1 Tax=Leisingera daeponensis TaxID=405746 RepID=A0ABS7NDN6_9RHOB|nr:enoyl-CoA hydratase/isomerase family protein [Leisingera daeponensis]MBY6139315.1 enoyl-CoA hydratase/isomerase family protein [Leisingera daeponensis]